MHQIDIEELNRKIAKSNVNEYLGKEKPINRITPLVSVIVQTYQHADYIEECLQGILMQKTDFPYEIIIGEDESTDGTREICKEYAERHPDKIRLFLRSRSDVISIGEQPTGIFNARANRVAACGNYIAICEGDDYWIDPFKLEVQIKAMESHPSCDISFHPAISKDVSNSGNESIICKHNLGNKIFSTKEIILGGASFCPTASLVVRKDSLQDMGKHNLSFSYFTQILGSLRGGALYIDKVMCVYRKMAINSWSQRSRDDLDYYISHVKLMNDMMHKTNEVTSFKFEDDIKNRMKQQVLYVLIKKRKIGMLRRMNFLIYVLSRVNTKETVRLFFYIITAGCKYVQEIVVTKAHGFVSKRVIMKITGKNND